MTPQESEDQKVRADLQALARHVDHQLPYGWGFVVLAFPFGAERRMNYVANAERADVVRAMYEFIEATKEKFGEHVAEEGAAAEDSELARLRQEAGKRDFEFAYILRCCAKAIARLERNGLKHDGEEIRNELANAGIEVQVMPDPTVSDN